jgi:lysophospholipase L1-like esterase
LGRAALLCAGCLVGLLLAEMAVRVFIEQPILPRFVRDAGFGVRDNMPGVRCRHVFPGDYDVRITTNQDGLRGARDYPRHKPSGVARVAVVGDSFVFGFGVNDGEVVSAALENLLNGSAAARDWEVLNFGVSGFGQSEELVLYQKKITSYSPDWVVLFYCDNDIGNNAVSGLFARQRDGSVQRAAAEFLPGVRMRERLYAWAPLRWLFLHSQLWNYVRNQLSARVQGRLLKEQGLRAYDDATPEAVELTRALFAEFVRQVRAGGARAVVFVIPTSEIKSNFPMTRAEVERSGAVLIDGREFLGPQDYHRRDGHWNAAGHRKAAEELSRLLKR